MLNSEQYEQLLKPLNPTRVAKRSQAGVQLSYLQTWDVKAHLIRIFGFGGWSWKVTEAVCVFEAETNGKWNVGYKVIGTLTIPSLECEYSEAAVGSSTQGQRGESHDMACKTAESDALKRAAINLGTQFGLSLYDNGQTRDVVMMTLAGKPVMGHAVAIAAPDSPTAAPEPVSDPEGAPEPPVAPVVDCEPWIARLKVCIDAGDVPGVVALQQGMRLEGIADVVYKRLTMAKWADRAVIEAGKKAQS